ncbi:MAG: hypothetical protein EP314_07955 [Bacteroidetes bacterium]|nr:MAG: hypothetical protein EP314_07955 [Bacteroidota bacterium]
MNQITPSSPILSLELTPLVPTTTTELLAKFHPIMRSLGFGNFEQTEEGLFSASKGGEGLLSAEKWAFAEVVDGVVIINLDGHSLFGLRGVETMLNRVKVAFENAVPCQARIVGPHYKEALLSNLIYTVLPIYLSAALVILLMHVIDSIQFFQAMNFMLYATIGAVGAKTRFWVVERRRKRPIWLGVLKLMLIAPLVLMAIYGFFWLVNRLA